MEAVQYRSDRLRFVRGACRNHAPVAKSARTSRSFPVVVARRLLADDSIETVVLAMPHSLHTEQIIVVAEARRPVMCKKPLAPTRADAAQSIEACRQAGVHGLGAFVHLMAGGCSRSMRSDSDQQMNRPAARKAWT